jgi:hypothetical protein
MHAAWQVTSPALQSRTQLTAGVRLADGGGGDGSRFLGQGEDAGGESENGNGVLHLGFVGDAESNGV